MKRACRVSFGLVAVSVVLHSWASGTDGSWETGPVTKDGGGYVQTLTREVPFDPGGFVAVENANGRIAVTTWDKSEVSIRAEKRVQKSGGGLLQWVFGHRSLSAEQAEAYLHDTLIEFIQDEGRIKVVTQ